MIAVKVGVVGEDTVLILGEEARSEMGVGLGNLIGLEVEEGKLALAPHPRSDPERREAARTFRECYRETFEALAK